MPSSVSGGQLPLTAFFGSRASQASNGSGKSREDRTAAMRKDSPARDRDTRRPTKKQGQNENNVPRIHKRSQGSADVLDKKGSSSRQKSDSPLHIDLSESKGGKEANDEYTTLFSLDENRAKDGCTDVALDDMPLGQVEDHCASITSALSSSPTTPPRRDLIRRPLVAASLPSPPLTASGTKRPRRVPKEQHHNDVVTSESMHPNQSGTSASTLGGPSPRGSALPGGTSARVVGNKDAIVLRSPHKGSKTAMPPPSLPFKVPSSDMPVRPPLRRARSSSSEKWVPSSQTQELSISPPRSRESNDVSRTISHTPKDQITHVVPSSQSSERELQMSDVLPPAPDIYKTPISPLRPDRSSLSPLVSDAGDSPDPLEEGALASGLPSPEVIESSQSQYEHEISPFWAETIAARQAALSWGTQDQVGRVTPLSSPRRPAESQDYDANDEYSQSQGTYSPPSTFATSQPRTSPLHASSQSTNSSGSDRVEPYPVTPSQFRRFVDMFNNRDEFGNELALDEEESDVPERSASPSPSSRRRARPELLQEGAEASPTRKRARVSTSSYSHANRSPRSRGPLRTPADTSESVSP
ncbi:hypothetical protein BD414DRAFT_29983 [Trametes punicea]|nr:hypothetical protein BD414DRAFT_29983 [Trametes punicea]